MDEEDFMEVELDNGRLVALNPAHVVMVEHREEPPARIFHLTTGRKVEAPIRRRNRKKEERPKRPAK